MAIVVGAGQTPGDTIGNGRATAILFAREGARVLAVDRDLASAEQTVATITGEGGEARAFAADATREVDCEEFVRCCTEVWGRVDVLHNNVGIGGGDAGPAHIREDDWDHILDVNLKSVVLPCKHVLPVMRRAGRRRHYEHLVDRGGLLHGHRSRTRRRRPALNAYTQSLAIGNAKYGIRANVIMPGLMNTPMAIEGISQALGVAKDDLTRQRDAQVPLGAKMGTAWDVAWAALFLASDEARFISGVVLPVDGGQSARIG